MCTLTSVIWTPGNRRCSLAFMLHTVSSIFVILKFKRAYLKFSVYGRKQTDIHTHTRVQWSHASVGLAQARPNKCIQCQQWGLIWTASGSKTDQIEDNLTTEQTSLRTCVLGAVTATICNIFPPPLSIPSSLSHCLTLFPFSLFHPIPLDHSLSLRLSSSPQKFEAAGPIIIQPTHAKMSYELQHVV